MKEKLLEIKNKLENNNTLGNEIIYILGLLGEKQIPTDRALLHSAFYEISSITNELKISELIFDKSTIFPYSKELEDALFELEISGILPYYISYDSKYDLSHLNKEGEFNSSQKEELEKGTQVLKKALIPKLK